MSKTPRELIDEIVSNYDELAAMAIIRVGVWGMRDLCIRAGHNFDSIRSAIEKMVVHDSIIRAAHDKLRELDEKRGGRR